MSENIVDRINREGLEASVALSHEPNHGCDVCVRVRKRLVEREARRRAAERRKLE